MLNDLRTGLTSAWESVSEGWRHLQERAGSALTKFIPGAQQDDQEKTLQTLHGPRWALLAAELQDDGDEVTVRIEVPGMSASDFSIEVRQRTLIVQGHKHMESERKAGGYHLMERAFGRFERMLALPYEVDEEKVDAKYKRGVLTITLPKHEQVKVRRIPVGSG